MKMRSIMAIAAAAVLGVVLASPARAQNLQDFKCTSPGQNSSATSALGLQPGEQVTINGNKDLSTCIQANDGGCVYTIVLNTNSGTYDNELSVVAQGPKGLGSGNMYLHFTDQTGDRYSLKVFSSTRASHSVRYNSKKPAITKIEWSN
jgi:hypothetical protein